MRGRLLFTLVRNQGHSISNVLCKSSQKLEKWQLFRQGLAKRSIFVAFWTFSNLIVNIRSVYLCYYFVARLWVYLKVQNLIVYKWDVNKTLCLNWKGKSSQCYTLGNADIEKKSFLVRTQRLKVKHAPANQVLLCSRTTIWTRFNSRFL